MRWAIAQGVPAAIAAISDESWHHVAAPERLQ